MEGLQEGGIDFLGEARNEYINRMLKVIYESINERIYPDEELGDDLNEFDESKRFIENNIKFFKLAKEFFIDGTHPASGVIGNMMESLNINEDVKSLGKTLLLNIIKSIEKVENELNKEEYRREKLKILKRMEEKMDMILLGPDYPEGQKMLKEAEENFIKTNPNRQKKKSEDCEDSEEQEENQDS